MNIGKNPSSKQRTNVKREEFPTAEKSCQNFGILPPPENTYIVTMCYILHAFASLPVDMAGSHVRPGSVHKKGWLGRRRWVRRTIDLNIWPSSNSYLS